jgi:hypothetical protein
VLGEIAELLDLAPVDGLVQCFAGREMAVECSDTDAGTPRHGVQACVGSAVAEHHLRRL